MSFLFWFHTGASWWATAEQCETYRDSRVNKWPMKCFWRWEDWPMREEDWLEVIYVPDIFNQITRHPLRCDYCDAQSWFLCVKRVCVCVCLLFHFSQGNSSCGTKSEIRNYQTGKQHVFLFYILYDSLISAVSGGYHSYHAHWPAGEA